MAVKEVAMREWKDAEIDIVVLSANSDIITVSSLDIDDELGGGEWL